MGKLTTHVLDTAHGCPAAGMVIDLYLHQDDGGILHLRQTRTNSDGRVDAPLLEGPEFAAATYELVFAVGDYFEARGTTLPERPFLGRVPIRFSVADASQHYHVPLLASPWSYTTYRGS